MFQLGSFCFIHERGKVGRGRSSSTWICCSGSHWHEQCCQERLPLTTAVTILHTHRFLASGAVAIFLSPSDSQLYWSLQPVLPFSVLSFLYLICIFYCLDMCLCMYMHMFLHICIYAAVNDGEVSKMSHFFPVTPRVPSPFSLPLYTAICFR